MKDVNGRPYARVADVKAGQTLEADDGFTCIRKGARLVVEDDGDGLKVACRHQGGHMLDGQIKGRGARAHYVGLYPVAA